MPESAGRKEWRFTRDCLFIFSCIQPVQYPYRPAHIEYQNGKPVMFIARDWGKPMPPNNRGRRQQERMIEATIMADWVTCFCC
ncbi:hypothetical protein A3860_37695 [Niastella vici]|uniref:Uncharacterized protein n=1 Tax=Niastella vici TaxID=1703345 RepID=A0A1V9FMA6_9BACT|nr:hypothetical protein A3860_37695 [Niastella vici]